MRSLSKLCWHAFVGAIIFASSNSFADDNERITSSPKHREDLDVRHFHVGRSDYILRINDTTTTIWRSYWGRGEAVFSPDGKTLALSDAARFDVLGPVLIYRIDASKVSLIYQSPGNWNLEEDRFGYELGSCSNTSLTIKVIRNEFDPHRSRARKSDGFEYIVDFTRLRPITPSFYDSTDPLYFNVNNTGKSHRTPQ